MPTELKNGTQVYIPKMNAIGKIICRCGSFVNIYRVELLSFDDEEHNNESKDIYTGDMELLEDVNKAIKEGRLY